MSTVMVWGIVMVVLAGYLAVDLQMARSHFRAQRSRGHQWKPFLRWWFAKSAARLFVVGGITAVVTSSLFLYQYGLVIPEFCSRIRISNGIRWALLIPLILAVFVLLDLFLAWRYYRNRRGAEAAGVRFYRWWLRRSALKFSVAGVLGILLLMGAYVVQRDDTIPLRGETRGYIAKAKEFQKQKKFRESVTVLRKVIQINPEDEEAHLQLARSLWSMGSKQDALNSYKTAIRLNPASYYAHIEMGHLAFNGLKETDLALSSAIRAAELAPDKPKPHLLLALIYSRTGRLNQAVEQYRIVLGKSPENEDARVKLIELFLARQSWDEAAREAERSPRNTLFTVLRARADAGRGKGGEAMAALKSSAQRDPVSPLPLIALGELLSRRGEYPLAATYYEDALKLSPDDVTAMSNLALLLTDHGNDPARALELASKACTTSWPRNPNVVGALGWVKFKQGKQNQALPLLREAAAGISTNPLLHYHYGAALMQAGQREEGRRELEAALKITQEFDGAATAAKLLGRGIGKQGQPRRPPA